MSARGDLAYLKVGRQEKRCVDAGAEAYVEPGLVKFGLVKTGDDLLDGVARGAEPAALPQHERRLVSRFFPVAPDTTTVAEISPAMPPTSRMASR